MYDVIVVGAGPVVKNYFGEAVPESAMCTPTDNRGIIMGVSLLIWRKSTICVLAGRRKRKSG